MLRFVLGFLFLASCSTVKNGGDNSYLYYPTTSYSQESLKEIAPNVIETLKRDPSVGKVDQLFDPKLPDIKRVAIVVFESVLQVTREGLSKEDRVYLSDQGKQLLTEKMLSIWEQTLPTVIPELDYVKASKIKKIKSLEQYGSLEKDFVLSNKTTIDPDDIFYLKKGKLTTMNAVMNPRGMRDVSALLVPASELMSGPKWSEHQKHYLNDIAKELKLDAVIVVMTEVDWTSSRMDKNSGEHTPEAMNISLSTSVLVPFTRYEERLSLVGIKEAPKHTVCFRTYKSKVSFSISITVPKEEQTFSHIEKEVLNPMLKTYTDLTIMTADQMGEDIKKTY